MMIDKESLLEECRKVRVRVSGYSREQKERLMREARKIVGEIPIMDVPSMSKPLTFKELEIGERFISFPSDGDDDGHGGYRGTSWIFVKYRNANGECIDTAIRLRDGGLCSMPDGMHVLRVS